MRVVAVRAFHQPFLHLVVEWHVELRLGVGVALEAKLGLLNLEQLLACLAVVNAVATDAAHVVLAVRGAFEVRMLSLVAAQTALIDLLRRRLGRIEDLRDIPSTVDVSFACSMAAFACHARLSVHLRQLGVRI